MAIGASEEVRDLLFSIIDSAASGNDILDIILEINEVINKIAAEITDPTLRFETKFQLIADLNFTGRLLDSVLAELTREDMRQILEHRDQDPFRKVMEYLKE